MRDKAANWTGDNVEQLVEDLLMNENSSGQGNNSVAVLDDTSDFEAVAGGSGSDSTVVAGGSTDDSEIADDSNNFGENNQGYTLVTRYNGVRGGWRRRGVRVRS